MSKMDKFDWNLPEGKKISYLTPSPLTFVPVNQTTPGTIVLSDPSLKTIAPIRLFCKDIVSDRPGEFIVSVSGSRREICRKSIQDMTNFIMDLKPQGLLERNMTVTVTPKSPMTEVKMNCIIGTFAIPN